MAARIEQLLLTPEEAADCLRVHRSTVYDLMRSKALASVKIGRARRIPAAELRRYVKRLGKDAA